MEKVAEVGYKHSFYCDKCGEYLGTTDEWDDGWYAERGEFELRLYVDGWYHIKKHFCESCKKDFLDNMKAALIDMGFKEDFN